MNRNYFVIIGGLIITIIVVMFAFSHGKEKEPKEQRAEIESEPTIPSANNLYEEAVELEKNDLVKSKEVYQKILMDHPDFEYVEDVQEHLEKVSLRMIVSNVSSPQTVIHEVKLGDTLGKLAKKYHTTIDLIKMRNNLKNDIIRVNQRLSIWTAPFSIYVDKSQNNLYLKTGDEIVKMYKVSTGKNDQTPVGEYMITSRLIDPVWFHHGVVLPPESPKNVLGTRWLGFDHAGYGIHGTVHPETIGSHETAGCVRMRNEDVEELYSLIPRGTKVVIVD